MFVYGSVSKKKTAINLHVTHEQIDDERSHKKKARLGKHIHYSARQR